MKIDFIRNTLGYREEAEISVTWSKTSGYWLMMGTSIPYLHTGGGGGKGFYKSTESVKAAVLKLVAEFEKDGFVTTRDPYTGFDPSVRIEC
jgi:hypothetical protein